MDENAIVAAVCHHLEARGWRVEQRLHTSERGVDVVARHGETGRTCYVEAKGGTSARPASARFGQPFTAAQIRDHVANAVFVALRLRSEHRDASRVDVLIAVPDDRRHRAHLASIEPCLRAASIGAVFVRGDGAVLDS